MGKLMDILKKNLRWVIAGATLALIMGVAFFGYRAYVRADAEFIFNIVEQTAFSTTAKTDARAKIDATVDSMPDEFKNRFDASKYTWQVGDNNNKPVFYIKDYQTTPGIAVLSEKGAGTSTLTATYKDSFYTDADGSVVTVNPGDDTSNYTYHELVANSQNTFTVTVPLRMTGYVGSSIMTAANNTFTVANDAFNVQYNAYTTKDSIDSTYRNDYHTVSFIYNPNVLAESTSTFGDAKGTTSFNTLGGGSSAIWATVDGIEYKLSDSVYVGVKNTSKGDAGITVEQGAYASLSEGYTNILTGNFGYEDKDGNKNVYFWTLEQKRVADNPSLTLVDYVDVSDSGVITGKYAGKTTVYASCKPMSESYDTDGKLKTEYASAIGVEVPFRTKFTDEVLVSIGDNVPLYTTAFDSNVIYTLYDNNQGAVEAVEGTPGLFRAVKEGTAVVEINIKKYENGVAVSTELRYVTIKVIDKLALSKSADSINVGSTTQVTGHPKSRLSQSFPTVVPASQTRQDKLCPCHIQRRK